ncbi:hypothetical protein [Streptomyces sp. 6N223]|uniref:hypothetical protein n=1 Tax=Streptomyces sp. 6N223 TaxID=3457412 RepID=UPI003FD15D00
MIVVLIVAAEFAFWAVLAAGLAVRYLLRMRRTSAALLLGVPLIDALLLTATAVDLTRGEEPTFAHGLAALYLGFTIAYGHSVIAWADRHVAYRFGGGPKPAAVTLYGMERAREEWRVWSRTLIAVVISLVVLECLIWATENAGDADGGVDPLRASEGAALRVLGIHGIVALAYTIWPKRAPADAGS